MGNVINGTPPNRVVNATKIVNEIAAEVNMSNTSICYTSGSASNIIDINCNTSEEAKLNIYNGYNACVALVGAGSCDDFYGKALDSVLCIINGVDQTITFDLVANCTMTNDMAASMNTDIMNDLMQKLDNSDDLGAVVFGSLSSKDVSNRINLTNIVKQAYNTSNHFEASSIQQASNVLRVNGSGATVTSIKQDSKYKATFSAYMQSGSVADMASTLSNTTDQDLKSETVGLASAAVAWAEAFEAMGTAGIIGMIVVGIIILGIFMLPILPFILPKGKGKSSDSSKDVERTIAANPEITQEAIKLIS